MINLVRTIKLPTPIKPGLKKTKESKVDYKSQAIYEAAIIVFLYSNKIANKTKLTLKLKLNQNRLDEYLNYLVRKKLVKIENLSKGIFLISLTDPMGLKAAEEINQIITSKRPISKLSVFSNQTLKELLE